MEEPHIPSPPPDDNETNSCSASIANDQVEEINMDKMTSNDAVCLSMDPGDGGASEKLSPVQNVLGDTNENEARPPESDSVENAERESENVTEIGASDLEIKDNECDKISILPVQDPIHKVDEPMFIDEGVSDGFVQEGVEPDQGRDESVPKTNYGFKDIPFQVSGAWIEFENVANNFLKGCKWAPDGSCALTNSDDNRLRIFNLPSVFYGEASWEDIPEMKPAVKMFEGELIYDYCWYPLMSSKDCATCCLVSTSRNNPIHMYDAYTGELRCSYRAFNQVDEIDSAYSVQFSPDGQKLYSGFNKIIRIFDVNVPGRSYEERQTKICGQYGIISALAVNSSSTGIYAVGSYLKSVGIYAESDGSLVCLLEGQQGGITHLLFSPDGTKIYSGGRKDPEIICWDLRNPGEVLYTLQREPTTNQRIYFDIDNTGKFIVSGNTGGKVIIWDATQPVHNENTEPVLASSLTYQAHNDCVNGISLHPTLPLLVTASGQRKFAEPVHTDDSSDSDSSVFTDKYIVSDNSLRLWWCGER